MKVTALEGAGPRSRRGGDRLGGGEGVAAQGGGETVGEVRLENPISPIGLDAVLILGVLPKYSVVERIPNQAFFRFGSLLV